MFAFLKSAPAETGPAGALPGRPEPIATAEHHFVNGRALKGPHPAGFETVYLAMGCYWGAERFFWQMDGVWVTAAGNIGGTTPNPTYEEVCTGRTGHAEAVMVVFDPDKITLDDILAAFWQAHDPTQGMRQGNDVGSQYRSGIYWSDEAQKDTIEATRAAYQAALDQRAMAKITTQIAPAGAFYFAEEYHQQYLAKNPGGYCSLRGTGVAYCAG